MSKFLSSSLAATEKSKDSEDVFRGFTPLEANYLYCPNQFFDICLPHSSRGTVRLVAYMLRRTLGWLDRDGQPVEQNLSVSYQELIREAGISRGAVRPAIEEAIAGGYILCLQPGRVGAKQQAAQAACYTLRWDEARSYSKTPEQFQGFYIGEGHRSPIPNAYFDRIVSSEPLTVIKIVGAVLRHTVGYESQFGRRPQAPLSFSYLQQYARIGDRKTLSQAIQTAQKKGYILRTQQGAFHPNANQRKAACYAVKWLALAESKPGSSKILPVVDKQSKNPTRSSSKSPPAEQFKNPTTEKKLIKNTCKQQGDKIVVADHMQVFVMLKETGFTEQVAQKLSQTCSAEIIQKQIAWFPHRQASKNPLGMLRKAIEEDWSEPASVQAEQHRQLVRQHENTVALEKAAQQSAEAELKLQRHKHAKKLQNRWQQATHEQKEKWFQAVLNRTTNDKLRSSLCRRRDLANPPHEALLEMARDLNVPITASV